MAQVRDIGNKIDVLMSKMEAMGSKAEAAADRAARGMKSVGDAAEKSAKSVGGLGSAFDKVFNPIDKVSRGLLKLHTGIIGLGLNLLVEGIQRVYDLKERWAKITGELNMRIGGLSSNIRQAQRFMSSWEGTVRGLTDQFGQGAAMAGDFLETMETMNKGVLKTSQVMGIVLARGFNLGGRAAGELMKSFRALHDDGPAVAMNMAQLAGLAQKFDVPLNAVAKDIAESSDFMMQFGEEGKKAFLTGAVYLKQFNVSLKDMQRFMSAFDTLDDAVGSVAKLNIVFGTTLSGLDMMLEQDPAARFEEVRQQLLMQGKTYDTMTRAERQMLSSTLQLSEKEVAFMLDRKKVHLSLTKFRDAENKQQINEQKAQKMMQKQLRSTAQTLFAFGAAADRITLAIAKALRPLLEMLGLVKSSDKEWKSFGQVMGSATDTIVRMFEGLAKSPRWIGFLQKLADVIKVVAKRIASLTVDDFKNMFERIIDGAKTFYKWSAAILAVWATMRTARALGGAARGIQDVMGLMKRGKGEAAAEGGKAGPRMSRGMGGAIGMALGTLTGGNTLGGGIGTGIGTALGALAGPIGMAVGGAVGGFLGKHGERLIKKMIDKGAPIKSYAEQLQIRMNKQEEKNLALQRHKEAIENHILMRRKLERDLLTSGLDKKKRQVRLEGEQLETARKLVTNMQGLHVSTGLTRKEMDRLSRGDGPVVVSSSTLRRLAEASDRYNTKIDALAEETAKLLGVTQIQTKLAGFQKQIEAKKAGGELATAEAIAQAMASPKRKKVGEALEKGDMEKARAEAFKLEDQIREKFPKTLKDELAGLEYKTAQGWELSKVEQKRLVQLKERSVAYKKEIEMAVAFSTAVLKANRATIDATELALKEKQVKQKLLEMEVLQMKLREDSNKDISQAMATSKGTTQERISAVLARGGWTPEQVELLKSMSALEGDIGSMTKMAGGGVITRPTRALLGEAGPEAIIPLRAMARGKLRQPTKFGGGAAKKMVNYASGQTSGGSDRVIMVAGDVILDGRKVGRHIVRQILEDSDG